MPSQRRHRQGEGAFVLPGEVVVLDYVCAACDRPYEVELQGRPEFTLVDCDDERLCDGCQKKGLIRMLLERHTAVPEDKLLVMTVEELLDLATAR